MKKRHKQVMMGSESGQAMVEGLVSLALLGFVWVAMFYYGSITSGATRSAVAARHAAWSAGNAVDVPVDSNSLSSDLFFGHMAVALEQTEGETDASGTLSADNMIIGAILGIFPETHQADVNITPKSGDLLHNLTSVEFPIVNIGVELTTVGAHCEWDSVDETWRDISDVITDVLSGVFGSLF